AVAVAHTNQCPYCIDGHTKLALRKGASPEQIMEAVWVAAEVRAGGAYAHSTLAMSAIEHSHSHQQEGGGAKTQFGSHGPPVVAPRRRRRQRTGGRNGLRRAREAARADEQRADRRCGAGRA